MPPSRVWLWALLLFLAPFVLYALHRLCLWLEARGHLYYWHKRPGGGVSNSLTPLQEVLDPPSRHVRVVHEEKRSASEDEGEGGPH